MFYHVLDFALFRNSVWCWNPSSFQEAYGVHRWMHVQYFVKCLSKLPFSLQDWWGCGPCDRRRGIRRQTLPYGLHDDAGPSGPRSSSLRARLHSTFAVSALGGRGRRGGESHLEKTAPAQTQTRSQHQTQHLLWDRQHWAQHGEEREGNRQMWR